MIEAIQATFPEIYRERKSQLSRFRLLFAAIFVLIVSWVAKNVLSGFDELNADSAQKLLRLTNGFQIFSLTFFGLNSAMRSISEERAQQTWDFQRLTPLGAWSMVAGKILASLLYPAFIFICFLAVQTLVLIFFPEHLPYQVTQFFQNIVAALASTAIGVLASSYSQKNRRGNFLVFFVMLYFMLPMFLNMSGPQRPSIKLLAWEMSADQWGLLTFGLAGVWATLAAKWRVGQDLLEGSRFWRIPSFIFFLYGYWASVSFRTEFGEFDQTIANNLSSAALVIPVLAYFLSVLDQPQRNRIQVFFQKDQLNFIQKLHQTPVWILSFVSVLTASALVLAFQLLFFSAEDKAFLHSILVLPLFLLRELFVFQLLVWMRVRSAAAYGFLISLLLYAIPSTALTIYLKGIENLANYSWVAYFLPYSPQRELQLGPIAFLIFQNLFLGFLLWTRYQKPSHSNQSKRI